MIQTINSGDFRRAFQESDTYYICHCKAQNGSRLNVNSI